MESVVLHHHAIQDNLDEIKFACLYFDKIEIPLFSSQNILAEIAPGKAIYHSHFNRSFTDEYTSHLALLERENIVTFRHESYDQAFMTRGEAKYDNLRYGIGPLIVHNMNRFYKNPKIETDHLGFTAIEGEPIDEIELLEKSKRQNEYYGYYPIKYVIAQVVSIIDDLMSNKTSVTTSPILDSFVKDYFGKSDLQPFNRMKNMEAAFAFESLRISLPNASTLSFEDVLELRLKLREELLAFKYEMHKLSLNYLSISEAGSSVSQIQQYAEINILPKISDLERKLHNLNLKFSSIIIKEIKDPRSYAPLLLSFFSNVPSIISLLVSCGLITAGAALDMKQEADSVRSDSLYYLIKLKKY